MDVREREYTPRLNRQMALGLRRETRIGRSPALMRVVAANLTAQDMVAITANLASLQPIEKRRIL